jgi:hypothetical protein
MALVAAVRVRIPLTAVKHEASSSVAAQVISTAPRASRQARRGQAGRGPATQAWRGLARQGRARIGRRDAAWRCMAVVICSECGGECGNGYYTVRELGGAEQPICGDCLNDNITWEVEIETDHLRQVRESDRREGLQVRGRNRNN